MAHPIAEWDKEEDLQDRHRQAHRYRLWCSENLRPGHLVRCHFPNPDHSSHHLHNKLATIYAPEMGEKHGEAIWSVRFLDGSPDSLLRFLHVFEFRPVSALEALARA